MFEESLPWLILSACALLYILVKTTEAKCVCGHEEGSHIEIEGQTPLCLGSNFPCRCKGFKKS